MSIEKCFSGSMFNLNTELYGDKMELAAAAAILDAVQSMQEKGIQVSLQNDQQLVDFFNQQRSVLETKALASLIDDTKEDFLFLNETNESEVNTIDSGAPIRMAFFNGSKAKTHNAVDVLRNIAANVDNLSSEVKTIVNQLIPMLASTNATVKIVPANRLINADTLMQYDPLTNTIEVAEETFNSETLDVNVAGFLHEVVHSTTVKAYNNPTTQQEINFRNLVDRMFKKYSELSTENEYGFTNELEFISELVTNREFQDEVRRLEAENAPQQNLWTRFKNAVARMFGYTKPSEVSELIEDILAVSSTSNYTGGLNAKVLEKKKTANEEAYKQSTIEQKLTYRLNNIRDNLENTLRAYDNIIKRAKDSTRAEEQRTKLKQLLNEIEEYAETNQWKAISTFITQLEQNLQNLKMRVESEDILEGDPRSNIEIYEKALASNAIVDGLNSLLADAKVQSIRGKLPLTVEEINSMQDSIEKSKGSFERISTQLMAFNKAYFMERFNNRTFASKVVEDFRRELVKEYNESGRDPRRRTQWVNDQLNNERKDEVDARVEAYITELAEEVGYDISKAAMFMNSAINTNSKLVQLFQNILNQVREKIVSRSRAVDLEMKSIFDRYNAKHGKGSPKEMYKNLYEISTDGNAYLKGTYTIKFKEAFDEVMANHSIARDAWAEENNDNMEEFFEQSEYKKWMDANTVITEEGLTVPTDNWKNDMSTLSAEEKETLAYFQKITKDTNKQTFKISSLVSAPIFGAQFYMLPSITSSQLERALEGQGVQIVKDKWRDLSQVRLDDVGYSTERYTAPDGSPIQSLKVNFRGQLPLEQQSFDLFTVYRLEAKNGINYEEKHNEEQTFKTVIEVAKNKDYYQTTGFGKTLLGKFINRNKQLTTAGDNSNTYKRLQRLMEGQVYDVMHTYSGSIGPIDFNKAINTINGWTASVGMTLNEVTAAANILNGKSQLFLETVAGNYITRKSLLNAEKRYLADIKNIFEDINRPIKTSFVNQLTDMYDVYGLISVSAKQAFIKNNAFKANLNLGALQFMQEGGEHWMQSTLTMAIMEEIKVMNKDGEFINKAGEVVEEAKAASLLDMHSLDKDGKLQVDPAVVFTTKSMGVEYTKGGKEMINALIKKKIFDTMGNYDSNMQPEAMRHWYGKLFMMYRKYLIPMGVTRWRGMAHVTKGKEDLNENQIFYNESLQEYEEGFYTTFARFFFKSILPAVTSLQFKMLSADWQNMTDYERGNFRKATVEMVITSMLLPLLGMGLEGLVDGEAEEDNRLLWFILLETRRLESELSAYRDIREQYRILNSPIPSVRMLQNITNLGYRLLNPSMWTEEYKQGRRKGQLKMWKNIEQIVPVLNSTNVSYKEKFEFIENITK